MADPSDRDRPVPPVQTRDQRLKAALRANLARRKAQARARQAADADDATIRGAGTGDRGDENA